MGYVPAFPEDNLVARVDGEVVHDTEVEPEADESVTAPEPAPVPAAPAPAVAEEGDGADPAASEPLDAGLSERERRLEARRRRQAGKRKHGRPR
jgi:hypothetical protein